MGSEEEEESVVSVEQAAAERRERLKALKAYAAETNSVQAVQAAENNSVQASENNSVQAQDDDDNGTDENQENNPNMKFRNYLPHDKQLQEGKLAPPVLPKFEDPIATEPPMQEKQEDPFLNIAPQKPNWDLRRDVQKKLDKLEKRTQKAIFQLMEEQEKQKILEVENGADVTEEYRGEQLSKD